jgi:hypothetical protein
MYDKLLKAIFYDIKNPAGFSSVEKLYKAARSKQNKAQTPISKSDVRVWLKKQHTYTLHKPSRRNFPRRQIRTSDINEQWAADLCDLRDYAEHNDRISWWLVIIDCFSRYAYVKPLKSKKGLEVSRAFESVLLDNEVKPELLQTDKGKEFYNDNMKAVLESHDIHHFSTESVEIKASMAERLIRTLRGKLHKIMTYKNSLRYIDYLPQIVDSYNNSHNRSIQTTPASVNKYNADRIRAMQWTRRAKRTKLRNPGKFKLNDMVRIQKERDRVSYKGFYDLWSTELFYIHKIYKRERPVTYILRDLAGEVLKGRFYEYEIEPVTVDIETEFFPIQEILQKKKDKRGRLLGLARFRGYPSKFDTWLPLKNTQAI